MLQLLDSLISNIEAEDCGVVEAGGLCKTTHLLFILLGNVEALAQEFCEAP